MKFLIITLLAVGTFAAENYSGPEWSSIDHSYIHQPVVNVRNRRIVGGAEVQRNSLPFQIALINHFDRTTSICSGTILTTGAILTAARCPSGTIRTTVIAGVHDRLNEETNQQRRSVLPAAYNIHNSYTRGSYVNDIAILKVPDPFTFNRFVGPVRLPTNFAHESFVNDRGTVSGWGWTTISGPSTRFLRSVIVPIISNEECSRALGATNVIHSSICSTTIHNQGACNDDFGAPLTVLREGDPRPVQVGILTFVSSSLCVGVHPNSYTRVTSFLGWIQSNL